MTRPLLFALPVAALTLACSSAPPPAPKPTPEEKPKRAFREPPKKGPTGPRPTGAGSSDGVTCEEAKNANNEELTVGKKGEKDLDAKELGAVLNHGQYLGECDVPQSTKVSVCAAVKNGTAVGVTVAMAPSDPELEKCVAGKVRALAFPASGKMDIVRTEF